MRIGDQLLHSSVHWVTSAPENYTAQLLLYGFLFFFDSLKILIPEDVDPLKNADLLKMLASNKIDNHKNYLFRMFALLEWATRECILDQIFVHP